MTADTARLLWFLLRHEYHVVAETGHNLHNSRTRANKRKERVLTLLPGKRKKLMSS